MKKEDTSLLRDIQKNTQMGLKAIDTIATRVYDDALALRLSAQAIRYENLHEKASKELLKNKQDSYRENYLSDLMLRGGIVGKTLLNTSTSHLAELLIQGNTMGLTQIWKSVNHNSTAGGEAMDLARELSETEEKNIWELRKFL